MSADIEWLPDYCPSWCDGAHAEAYAESGDWVSAQQHLHGGSGGALAEITWAGRHCRDFGAGWDLTATQRPLGPHGGYWGPELIDFEVHDTDRKNHVTLSLTTGEARVCTSALVDQRERKRDSSLLFAARSCSRTRFWMSRSVSSALGTALSTSATSLLRSSKVRVVSFAMVSAVSKAASMPAILADRCREGTAQPCLRPLLPAAPLPACGGVRPGRPSRTHERR